MDMKKSVGLKIHPGYALVAFCFLLALCFCIAFYLVMESLPEKIPLSLPSTGEPPADKMQFYPVGAIPLAVSVIASGVSVHFFRQDENKIGYIISVASLSLTFDVIVAIGILLHDVQTYLSY